MINRILIRVKVIQILYSYLLVEKHFTLEGSPSSPTKEKRFAYSLYLDFLVMLLKVSDSIERGGGYKPLQETKFISRLRIDETIRRLLDNFSTTPFPLESAVVSVADDVKESGVYKNFLKDAKSRGDDDYPQFWQDLFNLVIVKNAKLQQIISERPNFTPKAYERAVDMINRTLVNYLASQDNVHDVEVSLDKSLDKARELYLRLMLLPVELTDLEDRIIDDNRHKFLKSEEDINPNMRFVENRVIKSLREDPELVKFTEKEKISWLAEEPVMMRNLLKTIKQSDLYRTFMLGPENDIHTDADFWKSVFKQIIVTNAGFLESLEEKSVFWNDDLEIMTTFVLKSLRKIEEGETEGVILSKYKDREDARFGNELLRYVYRDKEMIRLYLEDAINNRKWEIDRLAFMDVIIILAAVAEIMNFPKIPIEVSINEYIELAKSYSGAKSGQFVHGILGAIIARLRAEGKLKTK